MTQAHATLSWVAMVGALVVGLLAFLTWLIGTRPAGRSLARVVDLLVRVVVALLVVQIIVGLVVFVSGPPPAEGLHLGYALGMLAAIPVGAVLGVRAEHGRGRSPTRYAWIAGAALVAAVLALRLAATG
ncbi:MAG: hypothetical protein U0869_22910 [Chloroflexota bacterium]